MGRRLLALAVLTALAVPGAPAVADDLCVDVSVTSPGLSVPWRTRVCVPN